MKRIRFLAWFLVCAIFFQSLIPAFSLTADAATVSSDSELTFNGGYPYGKDMTKDSVTLVAPVQGSGTIQWYQSTARDGEYTPISGATGKEYRPDFTDKSCYPDGPNLYNGTEHILKFRAYENGTLDPAECPKNWYRCTVNGQWSKPVQLLQAFRVACDGFCTSGLQAAAVNHTHGVSEVHEKLYQIAAIYVTGNSTANNYGKRTNNSCWYISNGYAAYTVYPKPETASRGTYRAFDVIGRYKHRSATQNYEYYWLGETNANMAFDTNNYEELRLRFDDDDEYNKRVLVDVKLPANQDKIAMAFSPRLGETKMYYYKETTNATLSTPYNMQFSGIISAIFNRSASSTANLTMDKLTGIQMIGSISLSSGLWRDTPAWNITFQEDCKPSSFWLGNDDSEMYKAHKTYNPGAGTLETLYTYDLSKYAYSFNTKRYETTAKAVETANLTVAGGKAVTSVQCKYSDFGLPEVYPEAAIAWTGMAGKTVTFGIAAGNVIDTKAACYTPAKCPITIGDTDGDPVIWMNDFIDDANTGQGYTYDGEPIELRKDKTAVATNYETMFTTAEVRRLLNVVTDLDYTFYEAEGTRTKDPKTLTKGAKLDYIPIDSRDYFLTVSVPDENPYFTGSTTYYLTIFAKPLPVYGVVAKDKYYDGKKTVEWDSSKIRWGDNSVEEYRVYERDHVETWWLGLIQAEFEDAEVGQNKKIVGPNGKDINIIHLSGPLDAVIGGIPTCKDNQWRNYVPYLAPAAPTASILRVPANTENALAPPEAETVSATSVTLKAFPTNGKAEYAMKIPDASLTDPGEIAADLAAAPTDPDAWQESPVFSGLAKETAYYFYLRLTGDTHFEDTVVTSKGAAISTTKDPIRIQFANPLLSKRYDGTPVEPKIAFSSTSPQCPLNVVEFTWREKIYNPETKQYDTVVLDGPPAKASYNYEAEISIKPEYADDYLILGPTGTYKFTFSISKRPIRLSSDLFTADDRAYDGTGNVTIHYNEDELKAAIEAQMVNGDTTAGITIVAAGHFSNWTVSNVTIPAEQAYENKPAYIDITMLGQGAANNYDISFPVSTSATVYKAGRTIAAPEIAASGEGSVTLAAPAITGVDGDDTAGTDGTISYAVAVTDTAPGAASALWQASPEFSGLAVDGTEYYLFARITGGTNYEDAISTGTPYRSGTPHDHNWDSENWEADDTAHWHKCLAGDCPVQENTGKDGYGPHDFAAWEKDPDDNGKSRVCETCGYRETVDKKLVEFLSPVDTMTYNGSPVEPQLKFKAGSPTCPEEAVEYVWRERVYNPETQEYDITVLNGPPAKASDYEVEISIKPEYAWDYAVKETGTFAFSIDPMYISGLSPDLFIAEDRAYDGTGNVAIRYDEAALRAAIEEKMVSGDTADGMTIAAAGQFSQWNDVAPAQAYENKPVNVSITMTGPGAGNYDISPVSSLSATVYRASRTISAPVIAGSGGDSVTLAVPAIIGVDDTAGTDGIITYAVAETDTVPETASALWQASPTFSGLASDGTEYYFFARITGGANYEDAVSTGTLGMPHTHNWDSVNWAADGTAHWHECLAGDCPVQKDTGKDGYSLHDFAAWEEDLVNGGRSRVCRACGYQETAHTLLSQISMGTWTWTKLYHDQDSELLFNMEEPTLRIFAIDSGKDLVGLDYACVAVPSDPGQLAEDAWQHLIEGSPQFGTFAGDVEIPETLRSGVYVCARARDAAGGVCYASTPKLVFDTVVPEIKNGGASVPSGCTYCSPQTVAVSDNLGLASVALDGEDVTASANAIRLEVGKHTIVAVDKAGNCTTVTIQVNNGHTNREWSVPASCEGFGITVTTCTVCGYTTTTPEAAAGHTWDTEYVVDQNPTCTEPGIKSLHCTKCGVVKDVREIPAAGHALEAEWQMGASRHWKVCSTCGERFDEKSHQGSGRWEPEPGRSAGEGVTEYMKCVVCDAILAQRYRLDLPDDPTAPRYGSVEKQTDVKPGAPEASWDNSLDDVLTAVNLHKEDLTDESHNAVSHKLVLSVSPLEGEAIPGQAEIEEKAEALFGRADAEFLYVDVSLTRHTYVEGDNGISETKTPITTTVEPIEIMLQIPEELQTPPNGMNRTFYLLYAHRQDDGTMESSVLEAHNNSGDGKLYFSASRFSTYAIAYVDTPIRGEPPTVIAPAPKPVPSPDPSVDHIDYIRGCDGQFRPDDYMSRAEAAQIFYRLLTDEPQARLDFDDVPETAWYREPVSALAGLGIIKGIGNNLFDPERPVTRAEFAAMAARFMEIPLSDERSSFPDIPEGTWYSGPVAACESAGWLKGYPDGLFHPTDCITRAQVVTIVNRMLKRAADEQALAERTMPFSDVSRTHWAYEDILEAAIDHKAMIQFDGSEVWE